MIRYKSVIGRIRHLSGWVGVIIPDRSGKYIIISATIISCQGNYGSGRGSQRNIEVAGEGMGDIGYHIKIKKIDRRTGYIDSRYRHRVVGYWGGCVIAECLLTAAAGDNRGRGTACRSYFQPP